MGGETLEQVCPERW